MSDEVRAVVRAEVAAAEPPARLKQVLRWASIPASTFFHRRVDEPNKRGRKRQPLDEALVAKVEAFAREYPWWGYKRLAVVMRRAGIAVSNHFVRQVFRLKKLVPAPQARRRGAVPGGEAVRAAAQRAQRAVAGGRDVHRYGVFVADR